MRRALALLALLGLLLAGCAGGQEKAMDQALRFRSSLLEAGGAAFTAEITADYGDKTYTFTADCKAGQTGDLDFTVTAPEAISGIAGTVTAQGGQLKFDDTALDFGLLADGQLSPAGSAYAVAQSWRSGYITACGREDGSLRMSVDGRFLGEAVTVDTWLEEEKTVPFYAEICYNNRRVLSLRLRDFQFL